MSTTIRSKILSIMRRRQYKGLTVGEIFDRLCQQAEVETDSAFSYVVYSSVRARVYELANDGKLAATGVRKDTETGRTATTYIRNT